MNEVVTTLTINADTSGADRFTQAMDGAETASQRATNAVTGMWAAIGGATVVAAVAGINSALDQVAKLNKGLADINQNAKMAGLTLEKYQSYKFAANVSGVDDTKLNDGLQKSAALLNDAQRNANSLTKLLDANGLSVRNANGDLISQNRLLDISANLMKKAATEQDKIKIAEMLGFTKQWVPFLEQGADAISRTASEAQAAGAVIDESTILKADEFDKAWRKSSTEWSAALKAAAVSVLPYIDDLITAAGKIFTKENLKGLAKPGQEAIAQVVPEAVQLTFKQEAVQAFQDWKDGTATFLEAVKRLPVNPIEAVSTARPITVGGEGPFQEQGPWLPQGWVKPKAEPLGPKTEIPANERPNDSLDRAIEQLEKHTARLQADTEAEGLGVAAKATARAETLLYTAALQAGETDLEKYAEKFHKLAEEAGNAALGLEKAKVASNIDFANQTRFASAEDVSIAQQLRGIYGNDVPAALASSEAGQIRVNVKIADKKEKVTTNEFMRRSETTRVSTPDVGHSSLQHDKWHSDCDRLSQMHSDAVPQSSSRLHRSGRASTLLQQAAAA